MPASAARRASSVLASLDPLASSKKLVLAKDMPIKTVMDTIIITIASTTTPRWSASEFRILNLASGILLLEFRS